MSNEFYKDSRFLNRSGGGFGTLDYYAVEGDLSDEEIYQLLVECGAWRPMVDEGTPTTDLTAAFDLARRHDILYKHYVLYCRKKETDEYYGEWCVGTPEYGGNLDPLSIASTPQRAICLFLLRYPEIARTHNGLPYAGWSTRYSDDK